MDTGSRPSIARVSIYRPQYQVASIGHCGAFLLRHIPEASPKGRGSRRVARIPTIVGVLVLQNGVLGRESQRANCHVETVAWLGANAGSISIVKRRGSFIRLDLLQAGNVRHSEGPMAVNSL